MLKYANRIKETTTTTGTGTYSLAGPMTGFQGFVAAVGDSNQVYYCCEDGVDWEIGYGTVTDASPDTLSRDFIEESSNSNNPVNWGAGTKKIYGIHSAGKIAGTKEYVGYNTIGTSTYTTVNNSQCLAKQITLAEERRIVTIDAYLKAGDDNGAGAGGVALYTDNGGVPQSCIAATPGSIFLSHLNTRPRWFSCPLGVRVPAGTYWIVIRLTDLGGSSLTQIAYDASGSDRTFVTAGSWFSDTTGGSDLTFNLSLRADTEY